MTPIEKEKLEVLNGDRGRPEDAAARLKHIRALVSNIDTEPSGNTVEDIRAIYAAINAVRVLLR